MTKERETDRQKVSVRAWMSNSNTQWAKILKSRGPDWFNVLERIEMIAHIEPGPNTAYVVPRHPLIPITYSYFFSSSFYLHNLLDNID